jgi:cold-inducible RNA-binding protein
MTGVKRSTEMRIYVGNLSYDVKEDELKQQFAAFGEVASVSIPIDRDSGRSRGYGFVDMANQEQAEAAILALNGKAFRDRALTVNEARPRSEMGGGGGGYRAGRGGGRGGDGGRSTRRY